MDYHVNPQDPRIAPLLAAAGISTRKDVTLHPTESVTIHGTAWDGGSRSVFTAIGADGRTRVALRGREPFRDVPGPAPVATLLPIGDTRPLPAFVVESGTFCGKPAHVVVHAHPSRLAPLLPERTSLSEPERRVLILTACLNSKGRTHWRERHCVSREAWARVVALLAARGLMTATGAITSAGRNAVEGDPDRHAEYRIKGLGD